MQNWTETNLAKKKQESFRKEGEGKTQLDAIRKNSGIDHAQKGDLVIKIRTLRGDMTFWEVEWLSSIFTSGFL